MRWNSYNNVERVRYSLRSRQIPRIDQIRYITRSMLKYMPVSVKRSIERSNYEPVRRPINRRVRRNVRDMLNVRPIARPTVRPLTRSMTKPIVGSIPNPVIEINENLDKNVNDNVNKNMLRNDNQSDKQQNKRRKIDHTNNNSVRDTIDPMDIDETPILSNLSSDSWTAFNQCGPTIAANSNKVWVSGTSIKNHLLNDPLLDWLKLYYGKRGFNTTPSTHMRVNISNQRGLRDQLQHSMKEEEKQLHILFEMGLKFEDMVMSYLREKFPNAVKRVQEERFPSIHEMDKTYGYMLEGVPIIEQAVLYNNQNKTFGVADILVRSDWLNKIVNKEVVDENESKVGAPGINAPDYHYRVVDIKWTTMMLCSDGRCIRNSGRFPAYKGQLAIYNATVGLLQGYTPPKAYILAKSWKDDKAIYDSDGNYNDDRYTCFDRLGEVDYENFDQQYINRTMQAINWVRRVRFEGDQWSCVPPSVSELYPNMCNHYDTPYHHIKKELSNQINELTQIWMVGVKNRQIGHENGIYKWSDKNCNSKNLGINGPKIGPIVDEIIKINRCTSNRKINPSVILNNSCNWQTKNNLDFYVDFESINEIFYDTTINLQNSKQESGVIFMVGVGYEEKGQWKYKSFCMDHYSIDEEGRILDEFCDFIESRIGRNKKKPTFFHWGNAEVSMFNNAIRRHNFNQRWTNFKNNKVRWLDFCKVFQEEPIVIKGAKKFNLKEVASVMNSHGLIKTKWEEDGPSTGLGAMIDAANFYHFIEEFNNMSKRDQSSHIDQYNKNMDMFGSIEYYNEVDCKVVWEIVNYLRRHHT